MTIANGAALFGAIRPPTVTMADLILLRWLSSFLVKLYRFWGTLCGHTLVASRWWRLPLKFITINANSGVRDCTQVGTYCKERHFWLLFFCLGNHICVLILVWLCFFLFIQYFSLPFLGLLNVYWFSVLPLPCFCLFFCLSCFSCFWAQWFSAFRFSGFLLL